MKYALPVIFLITQHVAFAQYKGGDGRGCDSAHYANANLGTSIFLGGYGEGHHSLTLGNQGMGQNIYFGGYGDGNDIGEANNQGMGQNIYFGGFGDGNDIGEANNQGMGQNIYIGGFGDGEEDAAANNQAMGQNIYTGGFGDGEEDAAANNQAMGQNIYLGGFGDGEEDASATNQGMGQSIYIGGNGDGDKSVTETDEYLGESIFLGGYGDGHAMIQILNTPLPMDLLSVAAKWHQNQALIEWQTATEINVELFEIQLFDGHEFITIGQLPAVGNSFVTQSYFFIHAEAINYPYDVWHYRIRSVDFDGSIQYSPIVSLTKTNNETEAVSLFPNPAKEYAYLQSTSAPVKVSLYNSEQKCLESFEPQSGTVELHVSGLAPGIYFIYIEFPNQIIQIKELIITH